MDKINFQNKKLPAVNGPNLNRLQENIDKAKYEKTGGLIDGECIVADISGKNIFLTKLYQLNENYRTSGKIKVLPNTTYIFSSKDNNVNFAGNLQFFQYSTQQSPTSQVFTFKDAFTTPENCNYIAIVFANANCPLDAKIQLEKGTVATEYCEPVNINNQVINRYDPSVYDSTALTAISTNEQQINIINNQIVQINLSFTTKTTIPANTYVDYIAIPLEALTNDNLNVILNCISSTNIVPGFSYIRMSDRKLRMKFSQALASGVEIDINGTYSK